MIGKVNHSSHLIDFTIPGFDYTKIEQPLEIEINSKLKEYDIPELNDWKVVFKALYGNRDKIYVYRQARSEVDMKYKEIVIHIPIPLKSQTEWGVEKNQVVNLKFPENNKYCESIVAEFENYTNKYDFIIDCMRKGIRHTFEKGFTVNKIKIKPIN